MNYCSYFIKDKALFGSYPTQQSVEELEQEGVRYFVDLTQKDEKHIIPYKTQYTYINYPIPDRSIPEDIHSFCGFIVKICDIIRNLRRNERVYINCRGGHGRAGLLVASILCYLFDMLPNDALCYTSKCHSNRSVMRDKWRKIGSPQTHGQKKLIYKLFQPLHFNKIYKHGVYKHEIKIENVGLFSNIFTCISYYKQMYDKDPTNSMFDIFSVNKELSWDEIKDDVMNFIVTHGIESNSELKENLKNTYLRPIIVNIDVDNYWGIGKNNCGQNKLGKILYNLKLKYILKF